MKYLELSRFAPLDYTADEALNTLCTNLSFSGDSFKKIMITSCHASEGKTFLSMNIMRTFARLGRKVVLIDADLRRSVISSQFGMRMREGSSQNGLAHYLAGMCEMDDILYATNITGAFMVPVGQEVLNSLTLLNSPKLTQLLDYLSQEADYILVDAPPIGVIIDAAEIAKSCDGVLITVSYNQIRRRELIEAKRQIEQTGCPVLGAVLNNVTFSSYSSKNYYNKSYYRQHYTADYYKSRKTQKEK